MCRRSRRRDSTSRVWLAPQLEELHIRLAGVVIENLAYDDFIRRYDRVSTLFYLDPPYYGSEADYGRGLFGRDDFERLAATLKGVQGRFILSINDRKEVRKIFAGFRLERVATSYTIGGSDSPRPAQELLISN